MQQKGIAPILMMLIVAIGALALGMAGWLYARDVQRPHVQNAIIPSQLPQSSGTSIGDIQQPQQPQHVGSGELPMATNTTNSPQASALEWRIYQNKDYGFEFEYPAVYGDLETISSSSGNSPQIEPDSAAYIGPCGDRYDAAELVVRPSRGQWSVGLLTYKPVVGLDSGFEGTSTENLANLRDAILGGALGPYPDEGNEEDAEDVLPGELLPVTGFKGELLNVGEFKVNRYFAGSGGPCGSGSMVTELFTSYYYVTVLTSSSTENIADGIIASLHFANSR